MFADHEEDLLNLAMLHYCFDGDEHPVLSCPHGNSKSQTGYIRTMPSTISTVRELSEHLPPRRVIGKMSQDVGGIMCAKSASQLPRNILLDVSASLL